MKTIKVWYLYHSSFALKIDKNFIIFDYFEDKPFNNKQGLIAGVIDPREIRDLKVYVFSSHHHSDHFNPIIFKWRKDIKDITYILSSDIETERNSNINFMSPHEELRIDNLHIRTLKSNDEGVAFHIKIDNTNIYFAGDLNWWKWDGEPQDWIDGIEKIYFNEMKLLKSLPVDIAFLPIDPRLEDNYALNLDYFTKEVHHESIIFPMHFSDQWIVNDWLKRDGYMKNFKIKIIHHRGECFKL